MSVQPFSSFGSPWRDMERLRREMNRLFADVPTTAGTAGTPGYPAMNVWTNEGGAVITAELPGVNPEDMEISVVGDTFTLSGNRQPVELPENAVIHRQERGGGRFSRVFRLPFPIDSGKVEADFDNGVLSVFLPRPESDKPRKIAIRAG
ncbi:MAG: Hsp20/alpha crystallin family protein [Anaerolineae bacterium]|nr:Hsp20/alpha crystallin family protein [Anaerolineae bacterium]